MFAGWLITLNTKSWQNINKKCNETYNCLTQTIKLSVFGFSSGRVCRRVFMRVFSLYCLWTSWAKVDASRQMCAKSYFEASLPKLTHFGSRKWEKRLAVAPTAGGLSGGRPWNKRVRARTQIKRTDSCQPPCLRRFDDAWGASQQGRGGSIRVRDSWEKGDDSLVQSDNFLPLFFPFYADYM